MKRWWNIAFQVAATAGQLTQLYEPFIPPKYAPAIQGTVAILQATVATIAHSYNPDGTPAEVPYIPPSPKP